MGEFIFGNGRSLRLPKETSDHVIREALNGGHLPTSNRAVSIRLAEKTRWWVIRAAEPISNVAQGVESENR